MAVLVGVLAPQYLSYIHKAKVAADQANLKNYYTEIQLDYASTGVYNPQVPLVDNIGEGGYELREIHFFKWADCEAEGRILCCDRKHQGSGRLQYMLLL